MSKRKTVIKCDSVNIRWGEVIPINNIDGPEGVRGQNPDNELIKEELNRKSIQPLQMGIEKSYHWIESQLNKQKPAV